MSYELPSGAGPSAKEPEMASVLNPHDSAPVAAAVVVANRGPYRPGFVLCTTTSVAPLPVPHQHSQCTTECFVSDSSSSSDSESDSDSSSSSDSESDSESDECDVECGGDTEAVPADDEIAVLMADAYVNSGEDVDTALAVLHGEVVIPLFIEKSSCMRAHPKLVAAFKKFVEENAALCDD